MVLAKKGCSGMRQIELICAECPLKECDSSSLWCIHSALTKPNAIQKGYMGVAKKQIKADTARERKEYWAERYRAKKK
jgi:hypothetical protein